MATDLRAVESATGESASTDPTFADFWLLYPRHVAKRAAMKAWARVPECEYCNILIALVSWRPVWRDKDPEYLPHPATYLNGWRWEDELPAGYRAPDATERPRTADPAPAVRIAIPEHVRALMAKLRARS